MRYTILGFNQEKAVNLGLDMVDLMLLNYVITANGSPNMFHIVDEGISYVWLSHKKIQEDLPILNIAEGTLRNRISELKKKGLIISKTMSNTQNRGSATYYSVSELTMSLENDIKVSTTSLENDTVSRPRNSKITSNSRLIDNIELNGDIDNIQKIKPKKKSLYEQSMDYVDDNIEDLILRENVKDWIKFMFNLYREQGKTLYLNVVKSKVNRLLTFNPEDRISIVLNALDNGWQNFYEPKSNKKSRSKATFGEDDHIISKKGEFSSSGEVF